MNKKRCLYEAGACKLIINKKRCLYEAGACKTLYQVLAYLTKGKKEDPPAQTVIGRSRTTLPKVELEVSRSEGATTSSSSGGAHNNIDMKSKSQMERKKTFLKDSTENYFAENYLEEEEEEVEDFEQYTLMAVRGVSAKTHQIRTHLQIWSGGGESADNTDVINSPMLPSSLSTTNKEGGATIAGAEEPTTANREKKPFQKECAGLVGDQSYVESIQAQQSDAEITDFLFCHAHKVN